MDALLAVISVWLSVNFALPAGALPNVELVPTDRMVAVRQERLAESGDSLATQSDGDFAERAAQVFAIYDDASQTIFLHESWLATKPADSSVLVHEMVHHVQNLSEATFACAGEREKLAYRAQKAWLALFDRDLESEFRLDPMTILVRTNCMY